MNKEQLSKLKKQELIDFIIYFSSWMEEGYFDEHYIFKCFMRINEELKKI